MTPNRKNLKKPCYISDTDSDTLDIYNNESIDICITAIKI